MKKRTWLGVVGSLLLVAIAAWWFGLFGGVDPVVAAIESQRDEMFRSGQQPTEAQRDVFFQQMQSLSDAQRQQLFERGRSFMQQRIQQEFASFFALSPAEQRKKLDAQVNDIIERRKSGQGDGFGPPGGRERFANLSQSQRDEFRKRRLDMIDPKSRAQMAEYREMLNDRLKERGQPPMEGPGPFPGTGPPGFGRPPGRG
jgi:hypothetical protein